VRYFVVWITKRTTLIFDLILPRSLFNVLWPFLGCICRITNTDVLIAETGQPWNRVRVVIGKGGYMQYVQDVKGRSTFGYVSYTMSILSVMGKVD